MIIGFLIRWIVRAMKRLFRSRAPVNSTQA